MERRKLLQSIGTLSAGIALTGCMGGNSDEAASTESVTGTDTEAGTGTGTAETTSGDAFDLDGSLGDSPDGLEVTSRKLYETNGEVGLRGTVENTGEQPYESIEVEVTLQDDKGEVLYEFIDETEEAATETFSPGASWQFEVIFEEAKMDEVTNYTINLNGDVAQSTGDEPQLDGEVAEDTDPNFEIVAHEFSRSGESASVTGEIKNTGDETANSVEVSVTLFDEEDNEIDVFTNSLEEEQDRSEIAPGDTWQFDVQFTDVDMQNVGYYRVSVDSDLV